MKIIIAIGAGILAQATGLLGVVFVKVPQAVWKSAAKDINAAGASMILHSTIATASLFFCIAGVHAKKQAGIIKSVELSSKLTWDPETSSSTKREFLQKVMKDGLPSWVSFPDWEKAPAIQAILRSLWPGINKCLSDLLRKRLQEILPITIAKLDFGSKPMTVFGLKVIPTYSKHEPERQDGLVALIDLRWAGEPDVELRFMGASVKMRSLEFSGQFRVDIQELIQDAPFMRKLTISLVSCPEPKLDLSLIPLGFLTNDANIVAAANVMSPWLTKKLKNAMLHHITWPKTIPIPLPGGAEENAEELATPLGVLTIDVHEGHLEPRQGKFGWTKRINPRISLVLPPAVVPLPQESKTALLAAVQGVFTGAKPPAAKDSTTDASISNSSPGSTLMEGDHHAVWTDESFSLVVTSRTQELHLVLSHTRSPGNSKNPMGFDKPLGSKKICLSDILPLEEEEFYTPPATPRAAPEVEDSACNVEIKCSSGDAAESKSVDARPSTAAAELEALPGYDLGSTWIDMESTNAASLAALLKEAIPAGSAESLRDADMQDFENDSAPEGWFNSPNLGDLMGTKLDEVIDDLDWMPLRNSVSGRVRVSFHWQPLRPLATAAPKNSKEEEVDKETKEAQTKREKSVAVVSPSKTLPKTLSKAASKSGSGVEITVEIIADPLDDAPPVMVPFCPCCSKPATECGAASMVPEIMRVLAREEKLRRDSPVSGVIAVLVERTKLHYGKVPAVPTLGLSLTRPASYDGALTLPPPLVSQMCKRRHHRGMLAWNQSFYLPVSVTCGELEDEVLKIRIDLGDVKFGMLGAGRWRQYRCGSAVSTLDMYDSYEDDVTVVACAEVPLKNLILRSGARKEKLVMAEPLPRKSAAAGETWTGPRSMNIGSMKVQMGWVKP